MLPTSIPTVLSRTLQEQVVRYFHASWSIQETIVPGNVFCIADDNESFSTCGKMWARDIALAVSGHIGRVLSQSAILPVWIHKPILIYAKNITPHADNKDQRLYEQWRPMMSSISLHWDAHTVLLPLLREGIWENTFSSWNKSLPIQWWSQIIIHDHNYIHAVDWDELKLFWAWLIRRRCLPSIENRLSKILRYGE